jgi:hypothetical protein
MFDRGRMKGERTVRQFMWRVAPHRILGRVEGNEMADCFTASAHDDLLVTRWATWIPPPSDVPFWMVHGKRRTVPGRPRRILRGQDEAITLFTRSVERTNAAPYQPPQIEKEAKHILRALRWTSLPHGES